MAIAEFASLVSLIKSLSDLAQTMDKAREASTLAETKAHFLEDLINLRIMALDLHEKHTSITKERDSLERQIVEMRRWAETAGNYRLEEISTGTFVYVPNETHPSPTPTHRLCPNCFDNESKKSILQLATIHADGNHDYQCPQCKTVFRDRSNRRDIPPPIIRRRLNI